MFRNFNANVLGTFLQQSEIIELALSFGFKSIDIDIAEFSALARLKGLEYARRLIDSAQIPIGSFELPGNLQASDEEFQKFIERLPEYCQNATALRCTRCFTTLAPFSETRPLHENFELHRQRLSTVCGILKQHGIRLALGFKAVYEQPREAVFQFIRKLDELLPLVQAVKAENLGLLVNVWDIFVAHGNLDILFQQPKELITVVHLADVPQDAAIDQVKDWQRAMARPGGRIDCVAVLKWLRSIGYDGPVTPMPTRRMLGTGRADLLAREIGLATLELWHAAGLPLETRYANLLKTAGRLATV